MRVVMKGSNEGSNEGSKVHTRYSPLLLRRNSRGEEGCLHMVAGGEGTIHAESDPSAPDWAFAE